MNRRTANIKKVLQLDASSKLKLPVCAFECARTKCDRGNCSFVVNSRVVRETATKLAVVSFGRFRPEFCFALST
jgi:hypothetical protein